MSATIGEVIFSASADSYGTGVIVDSYVDPKTGWSMIDVLWSGSTVVQPYHVSILGSTEAGVTVGRTNGRAPEEWLDEVARRMALPVNNPGHIARG